MKCFSVHMTLGIIEGIQTHGDQRNLIRIGDRHRDGLPTKVFIDWRGRRIEKRPSSIQYGEIVLQRPMPRLLNKEDGMILTRHVLYPYFNSRKNCALVMFGSFEKAYQYASIRQEEDGTLRAIAKEELTTNRNLIRHLMTGKYFNRAHQRFVWQTLCIMRPGSSQLLLANEPENEDILVSWDGNTLQMIRKPDLSQIIV